MPPTSTWSKRLRPLLAVLILCALAPLQFACSTTTPPRDPLPTQWPAPSVFHDDLDRFLARHVDQDGLVDYASAVSDRADLDRYVALIATVSPDNHPEVFTGQTARLAYWMNAYNASVLQLVLDHYPIGSVRDFAKPKAFFFLPAGAGFFYFQKVVLGGERMHLYGLENGVIRKRFDEPRIHFAINCASIGCPRLPNEAFVADRLEDQLDREARQFMSEARNVRLDEGPERARLHLSSIFDWFEKDFTGWLKDHHPENPATLSEFVARYSTPAAAARIRACERCRVDFIPYDWSLNDASTHANPHANSEANADADNEANPR